MSHTIILLAIINKLRVSLRVFAFAMSRQQERRNASSCTVEARALGLGLGLAETLTGSFDRDTTVLRIKLCLTAPLRRVYYTTMEGLRRQGRRQVQVVIDKNVDPDASYG
jgi:hypothetical protein